MGYGNVLFNTTQYLNDDLADAKSSFLDDNMPTDIYFAIDGHTYGMQKVALTKTGRPAIGQGFEPFAQPDMIYGSGSVYNYPDVASYNQRNTDILRRSLGLTRGELANNVGNMDYAPYNEPHAIPDKRGVRGRLAVFKSPLDSIKDIAYLLKKRFGNLRISDAMYKYAPPKENNTVAYVNRLKSYGVPIDKRINDLTEDEFNKFIEGIGRVELGDDKYYELLNS